MSFLFYQTFWSTLQHDLHLLLQSFYNHTLDLSKSNHASIVLIPETEDAANIKHFLPISLINCSFKIITKIMAMRLEKVMNFLIDHTQTAFIKGRIIFDNIDCAQEILYQVKTKKSKVILLKLDFEKAFDNVNWDFLLEILQARGFGPKWIRWIKDILDSGQTCVNING